VAAGGRGQASWPAVAGLHAVWKRNHRWFLIALKSAIECTLK
jgi:hypothetical protein